MTRFSVVWLLSAFLMIQLCGCLPQLNPRGPALRVELQAVPPAGSAVSPDTMDKIRQIELDRTKAMQGIAQVDTQIDGDKLTVVFTPAPKNRTAVVRSLVSTGRIEFYWLKDVQNSNNLMGKWNMHAPPPGSTGYIFTDPRGTGINSETQPKAVLARVVNAPKNKPVLTGADLLPNARADSDQSGRAIVDLKFNAAGTTKFRDFTNKHVGEYLAIFYDGKLLSAPIINEPIVSGRAQVSGFSGITEARQIAESLNAGRLPVPLKVVGSSVIR